MSDLSKLITKAEMGAARKLMKDSLMQELRGEIDCEARRIAKKFVKENRAEIERHVISKFRADLSKEIQRMTKSALERIHLYMDDR